MNKKAIVFNLEKRNFYSLTPLIATIDDDSELSPLDLHIENDLSVQKIKVYLSKYDKVVFAFSFRTAQLEDIYLKMEQIYKSLKDSEISRAIFIAGGSHPSGDPLSTLRLGFDYAFIGEGEYSISLFLKKLINDEPLEETPGIAYFEALPADIKINPAPPIINLDLYPMLSKKRRLFPPLEITRGCSFGCAFCQVPSLFHRNVRHRSPEVILDTVRWMGQEKLDDIRFITPNSFGYLANHPKKVNIDAIISFLTAIKMTKGIRRVFFGTFPGEVRPETVSEELMEKLKPIIANKKIAIGLQSGSNRILQKHYRGHSVEEGLEAIRIIKKFGFIPIVDFIFGLPGATEEDEFESIKVIEDLISLGAQIRPHVFMPLPGSKLANESVGATTKKIRRILGRLSNEKKIEGNWSNQEKYAYNSWKVIKKIETLPIIHKLNKTN
ncbi:MAG: TIGR04013 family B12-binding domain/radical SAM domain-containing protein [Candidatus Heimdallarchaeaceae archaeon]